MKAITSFLLKDPLLLASIFVLHIFGLVSLHSVAPDLFPTYLLYTLVGSILLFTFSNIHFEITKTFSPFVFILCILFLLLPLLIGQVTRGAVRWIQIGPVTIQPTELVRPFLIVFFATYLSQKKLTLPRLTTGIILFIIPAILILIQPSLGVTLLTALGFGGALLANPLNKKSILILTGLFLLLLPLAFFFLAPYQKERIISHLSPLSDPSGAGYNSAQATISVGSGKIIGRGLGRGVQTQLSFLPERQTDFIFASIAEEMGFTGAFMVLFLSLFILYKIITYYESGYSRTFKAFSLGLLFSLTGQILIHIGMNMGLLPITGQPLPFVSAGGSSLLATFTSFGILISAKKPYA
jgi:cell division protein FtsW (lipid II flippase)